MTHKNETQLRLPSRLSISKAKKQAKSVSVAQNISLSEALARMAQCNRLPSVRSWNEALEHLRTLQPKAPTPFAYYDNHAVYSQTELLYFLNDDFLMEHVSYGDPFIWRITTRLSIGHISPSDLSTIDEMEWEWIYESVEEPTSDDYFVKDIDSMLDHYRGTGSDTEQMIIHALCKKHTYEYFGVHLHCKEVLQVITPGEYTVLDNYNPNRPQFEHWLRRALSSEKLFSGSDIQIQSHRQKTVHEHVNGFATFSVAEYLFLSSYLDTSTFNGLNEYWWYIGNEQSIKDEIESMWLNFDVDAAAFNVENNRDVNDMYHRCHDTDECLVSIYAIVILQHALKVLKQNNYSDILVVRSLKYANFYDNFAGNRPNFERWWKTAKRDAAEENGNPLVPHKPDFFNPKPLPSTYPISEINF